MRLKIWCFICIFWIIGCDTENLKDQNSESVEGYPVAIKDASEKEVSIKLPPKRIVVAGTSLYAEILIDLDAKKNIVGIADSANTPVELSGIASIGNAIQPSLEVILSLKPDIVFGVSSGYRDKIENAGVPVFVIGKPPYGNIDSLAELFRSIENIDHLLWGNKDKSKELIQKLKKDMESLQQKITTAETKTIAVMYFSPKNPPYAIGKSSIENELLTKAKAYNVFEKTGSISTEDLIKLDPEIVITDPSQIPYVKNDPIWQELKAVKNDQVFGVNASYWTSSRIGKTFKLLVQFIYPETFSEIAEK